MKRILTLLAVVATACTLSFSQNNGPCFDFDNKATTAVQTNPTASIVLLLDNWSTRCANLQYSNAGSQGGASDVYLRGLDVGCGNAGSIMFNSVDYAGDWLTFGKCFCYDFRIFNNGNPTPAPPTNLQIYWGPDPLNVTYKARFVLVNPVTVDSGWVTICPPIALADPSTGDLPSNSYGQWEMTVGSGAAAWDSLIQNVTGISYSLDIGASPTEQYGFDNICFTDCPEDNPCDRLDLNAQFEWSTGDSLWTIDVEDLSTVDSAGTIAWIEWCLDTALIPAFAGDTRTLMLGGPGTYVLCQKIYGFVTDSNGVSICCKDTICDTITVDICDYHNPAIQVTQTPDGSATVTLTDASQNGTRTIWVADTTDPGSLYITTGTGTSITHTYPGPGVYTACMVSWWHYDGVLCCIDTVYATIVVGQINPCDTLKPWADIHCTAVVSSPNGVGYVFTDVSSMGTSSQWYLNGVISGPGSPITGGPGSNTGIQFFPPGQHRVCLVSVYANAVGIVCYDTVCKTLLIPQVIPPAICDTHQVAFTFSRGRNFTANFNDASNLGNVSLWSFDGLVTIGARSSGTGSSTSYQFPSAGPHRVCLISIVYPVPGDTTITCRDTLCRQISFNPNIGAKEVQIAPNPVQETARIFYPPQPEPVALQLTDLQGNTLVAWQDNGDGETEIRTGELSKGMYLVSLRLAGKKQYLKFLKQ